MKKLFLLLAMAYMSLSMSAQSLIGTWKTDDTQMESSTIAMLLVFKDQKEADYVFTYLQKADFGKFRYTISIPGIYEKKGDFLSLDLQKDLATAKLSEVEFTEEIKVLENKAPGTLKKLTDMLETGANQVKDSILKGIGSQEDDAKILTFTDTVLELQTSQGNMTYIKME